MFFKRAFGEGGRGGGWGGWGWELIWALIDVLGFQCGRLNGQQFFTES